MKRVKTANGYEPHMYKLPNTNTLSPAIVIITKFAMTTGNDGNVVHTFDAMLYNEQLLMAA